MNLLTRIIAAVTAVAGIALTAAAPAAASPTYPTSGDRILYIFESDVASNESSTWFDANSDITQYESTSLPDYDRDSGRWRGAQRVTAASTTQLVASSFQTSGYYVACRIYVNDTLIAEDSATGRYAVVSCA